MGVAALRWQGRRHVVASIKGQALARAGKAGACLSSPGVAYPGCSSHRTGGVFGSYMKEVVCEVAALGSSGRTPNHQLYQHEPGLGLSWTRLGADPASAGPLRPRTFQEI